MDALNKSLLAAIKTTLWNEPFFLEPGISESDLLQEARRYEISAFLSRKIIPFCKDKDTINKWLRESAIIFRRNLIFQKALCDLNQLLSTYSIKPIILKGFASAHLYEIPFVRQSSDIDFIVLESEFDSCCSILDNNDFKRLNDDSRHIEFFKNGIEYECHRYFSRNISTNEKMVDKLIFEGCKKPNLIKFEGCNFYSLPDKEYGIMMLEHLRHHLKEGVGFRQIIDWVIYADKHLNDEFWNNNFKGALTSCGLLVLAKTVTKTCQLYLGLRNRDITWCNDIANDKCKTFIQMILFCNNFGFARGDFMLERALHSSSKSNFFISLNDAAKNTYMPISKKFIFLRPVAWMWTLYAWIVKYFKGFIFERYKSNFSKKEWNRTRELLEEIGAL